jgi:tetratricopeptide (TPR) repeat protein
MGSRGRSPRSPDATGGRSGVLGVAVALAALAWDPAAPAADPKRLLLLLVAAAALATAPRQGGDGSGSGDGAAVEVSAAAALFVAFVALGALSLAWGDGRGWPDLATLGGAALLLVGASLRPRAEAAAMARACASVLGGGAALWTLLEAATGARGLGLHGGQGNPNWLGLVLAVTLPLSLSALRGTPRGSRRERLAAVLVLPQIPALLLAQSRTAWVALAVAGVVTLADPRVPFKRNVALVLSLAIGALAMLLVAQGGAMRSLEGRIWIWRLAARAAAGAPPWGEGLGAFPGRFLDLQGEALAGLPPPEAARRFVNATSAHDDWLEITLETGVPGLLLLASAIGAGVVACRRAGARAEAATLVAFTVAALADSPLRQPAVLAPLVLALSSAPRTLRLPVISGRGVFAVAAPGLLAAAVLIPIAGASWLGAHLATEARDADPDRKAALLSRAAAIDPRSGEIAFAAGVAHLERSQSEAAIAELERSRPLLPQVATDVAIGNARLESGDATAAVAAYERALRLDPGSFRAHANLAVALRRLGRDGEADLHLHAARLVWPHHPALAEIAERP